MLATTRAPRQALAGYNPIPAVDLREEQTVPRVSVNGFTLAESDHTEVVEGNHYFPPDSVNLDALQESETRTHCP